MRSPAWGYTMVPPRREREPSGPTWAAGAEIEVADPAADGLAAAIDHDALRTAMARLSETHRRVLALRFYDDLAPDEVPDERKESVRRAIRSQHSQSTAYR